MISRIKIRNFKSLGDVDFYPAKFTCLVGMNGAGKSSLIQALDFVAQLMRGRVSDWLNQRGWSMADLNCKSRRESNIGISIDFETSSGALVSWSCVFNRSSLRCTHENVWRREDGIKEDIFTSKDQTFAIHPRPKQDIPFTFQGSILSALKDSELPEHILEFKNYLLNFRSLELLSPLEMRRVARADESNIGIGGEKLAGYLHTIRGEQRARFIELLKLFYPRLEDFKVASLRAGWKKLSVIERYGNYRIETEARHISDGVLRIMAVLSQVGTDRSLILLDEIENGINQEIIENLVDTLVKCPQQILVTTHSPLILNYLNDDVARKSVQFIYRAPNGESRIRPLFDIPRMSEKLDCMGPGDAFVDTDLRSLEQECIALDAAPVTLETAL
jgi:predicted ATPase